MADQKFVVSSSPHISTSESTRMIMLDVIIALMPALIAGWFYFGIRALAVTCVSVVSCVAAEYVYQWLYKGFLIKNAQQTTLSDALRKSASKTDVGDLSAVVTGVLLAFNLPATIPFWDGCYRRRVCNCDCKAGVWRHRKEFCQSCARGARVYACVVAGGDDFVCIACDELCGLHKSGGRSNECDTACDN